MTAGGTVTGLVTLVGNPRRNSRTRDVAIEAAAVVEAEPTRPADIVGAWSAAVAPQIAAAPEMTRGATV